MSENRRFESQAAAVLKWAESAGFPRIDLAPGRWVGPGKHEWEWFMNYITIVSGVEESDMDKEIWMANLFGRIL